MIVITCIALGSDRYNSMHQAACLTHALRKDIWHTTMYPITIPFDREERTKVSRPDRNFVQRASIPGLPISRDPIIDLFPCGEETE